MRENTIILNTIARTMNAGGSAIVSAFDAGASAINCTISAISPGERTKLRNRIKTLEKKIQELYVAIGKETSKYADPAVALESEAVAANLGNIKGLVNEIEIMRQRIAEIDIAGAEKKPKQECSCVADFFAHSMSGLLPGEKAGLLRKISANEQKIQKLYLEFAKETAIQPDPSAAVASEPVIGIIARINGLKAENDTLKLRIAELQKTKTEKARPAEKKPQQESSGVAKSLKLAISEFLPSEKSKLVRKIAEHEKKIKSLYLEVAKETAKYPDPADAISAEPVIGIISRINELKAESAALNQRILDTAEVKKAEQAASKVKPEKSDENVVVRETPQTAGDKAISAGTSVDSHATGSGTVVTVSVPAATGEMSEGTSAGFTRTKPCLIPSPELQPPTSEELETTARRLQEDAEREERINEILQEHAASTALPAEAEELPEQQEAETGSVPVVPQDEITPPDPEPPEMSEMAEETVGSDETPLQEVIQPVPIADEEEPSATMPENDDAIVEPDTEETPLPEEENTSRILLHSTSMKEFSGFRTRTHMTTYPPVSGLQPDNPSPDIKPGTNLVDESSHIFRTRVHQNTFSTIVSAEYENSADNKIVTVEEESTGNDLDSDQQHFEAEAPVANGDSPAEGGGEGFSVRSQVLSSRSRKGNAHNKPI